MPRLNAGAKKTTLSTVEQYELNQWLEQHEIHSNNLRRSFTDVLPLARLLSRHYPELIDLNIYPPRNSVHNKVSNWESFNKRVLSRLGVHLTRDQMMRVARSVPGSVDLLLYSVMRVQVANERKRREREEEAAASDDEAEPLKEQLSVAPTVAANEDQGAGSPISARSPIASGSTLRTAATMPRTMKQAKAAAGARGGGRGTHGRNRGATKTGMASALETAAATAAAAAGTTATSAATGGAGAGQEGAGGASEPKRGELLYELISTELFDPKQQLQQQQQPHQQQQSQQQQQLNALEQTQFELLPHLTPQQKQKRTVLYSHYMQAVKNLQLKNAKIARIDQCTAHLENMLQLKCDRIEDLKQQVDQAKQRLRVAQAARAVKEQARKTAAIAAIKSVQGKMLKAKRPLLEAEQLIITIQKAKKAKTATHETKTATSCTTTTTTMTTEKSPHNSKLMPKNTKPASASKRLPLKLTIKKISKKLPNAYRAYMKVKRRAAYDKKPKTLIPLPPMPYMGGDGFDIGLPHWI